jgi:hypothetical protein
LPVGAYDLAALTMHFQIMMKEKTNEMHFQNKLCKTKH